MRPHEGARMPRRNCGAQPISLIGGVFDLGTCRQGTGWDPGRSPLRGSRYTVMLLQSRFVSMFTILYEHTSQHLCSWHDRPTVARRRRYCACTGCGN